MDVALIMNHNENFSQKFSTLFILSFICLFNLILINLDLEGNISISNEESFTDSIDDYSNIRQLQHKPDEDDTQYKTAVMNFFNNMSYFVYEGTWESNGLITNFEHKNGTMRYHLGVGYDTQTNKSILGNLIKVLDGGFIDNWYYIQLSSEIKDITSNDTELFYFNKTVNAMETFTCINYTGLLFEGKVFDKMGSSLYECPMNISYMLNYAHDDIGTAYINRIKGKLSSTRLSCDVYLDLDFDLKPELISDPNSAHLTYSIVLSTMILVQMIINAYLTQTVSDSLVKSNSLSLFTVGQNVIWNAYGCLSHFFLAVNFSDFGLHFGIPAFLYFTNFSVFELKLIYTLWKNQNSNDLNNLVVIRRKLIKFYITFYIFMFVSLFFITKFYFDYPYIITAIALTWVPQIIHNVVFNNSLSLPLVMIILYSLNKVMLPLYFRGYPGNIFHLKTSPLFVYWAIGIIFFEITVLLCQSLIYQRFFIPFNFGDLNNNQHKFYYTKEELLQVRSDLEFSECAICLYPLFTLSSFQENFDFDEASSVKSLRLKFCLKGMADILFNFHTFNFRNSKPYMLTPCNHAFHSSCLESWLKMKKECPTDRTTLPPVGLN